MKKCWDIGSESAVNIRNTIVEEKYFLYLSFDNNEKKIEISNDQYLAIIDLLQLSPQQVCNACDKFNNLSDNKINHAVKSYDKVGGER